MGGRRRGSERGRESFFFLRFFAKKKKTSSEIRFFSLRSSLAFSSRLFLSLYLSATLYPSSDLSLCHCWLSIDSKKKRKKAQIRKKHGLCIDLSIIIDGRVQDRARRRRRVHPPPPGAVAAGRPRAGPGGAAGRARAGGQDDAADGEREEGVQAGAFSFFLFFF